MNPHVQLAAVHIDNLLQQVIFNPIRSVILTGLTANSLH